MKAYVNGKLVVNQTHIVKMIVPIPPFGSLNERSKGLEDYAANVKDRVIQSQAQVSLIHRLLCGRQ
jgi:hypothetical protein